MSREHETAIKRVLSAGKSRRATMLERPGFFVAENQAHQQRYKQLPAIYNGEPDIHFDPFSGAILFPSSLSLSPADYKNGPRQIIGKRGDQPKEILAKIRINEYADIEAAIRSCLHRLESVGRKRGVQVQNVLAIARHIGFVLDEFSAGRVGKDRIPELADLTETVLEESGYAAAIKPNKRLIAGKMKQALEPDSINRVENKLRSTVMLASAWTLSHEENILSDFAQVKYERFLSTLLATRSISRHGLARMQGTLTRDLGLETDFDGIIHSRRVQLPPQHVSRVVQDITRVSKESLQDYQIKAAPYRQAALATKYLFFGSEERRPGSRKDHAHMLQCLLGSEWFGHLDNFPPLPANGAGLVAPAFGRDVTTRGVIATSLIDAALVQGDQGLIGKASFEELTASNSLRDIWSAAEQTFR